LKKEGKALYRTIYEEWELDPSAKVLLETACSAFDRLCQARKEVDKLGIVLDSPSGMKRVNPALRVEKEARSGFLQAWRMLNLDVDPPGDIGRPPGR
jgi:phage terminase small subunit